MKWACRDNLYAGYTAEQRQSRLTNATSFLMTASCPPSTPRHLVDACGDQSKYLPVSVRSSDGKGDVTVFANTFCAQCHGVDVFSAIPWKVSVIFFFTVGLCQGYNQPNTYYYSQSDCESLLFVKGC